MPLTTVWQQLHFIVYDIYCSKNVQYHFIFLPYETRMIIRFPFSSRGS